MIGVKGTSYASHVGSAELRGRVDQRCRAIACWIGEEGIVGCVEACVYLSNRRRSEGDDFCEWSLRWFHVQAEGLGDVGTK